MNHSLFTNIGYVIGLFGIAGACFAFFRYDNYKATTQLQNDNIKALQDQASILESKVTENINVIEKLQSRIEIVETLPLEAILTQLKLIISTQNAILKALRK